MCLKANSAVKPLKVNSDGFCSAWKVVTKGNCSPYADTTLYVYKHVYKMGENVSNGEIHSYMYDNKEIDSGFHLFITRKDAREEIKEWKKSEYMWRKIIKVYYKPEDVIAYGYFKSIKSVTVTKLTVKSLKGV